MSDFELSVVKAPRCEECGLPLKGFDGMRWECLNCETGPVVVDGVYPFQFAIDLAKKAVDEED
jgi:hypothetical protein